VTIAGARPQAIGGDLADFFRKSFRRATETCNPTIKKLTSMAALSRLQ
jgi:hypothetical protein